MARKPSSKIQPEPLAVPDGRPLATRTILMAGVAGACALGVGLGLWARPAVSERRLAIQIARPIQTPPRTLEIILSESPAPLGAPLEVMSRPMEVHAGPVTPEFMAPARPAAGLVRVQSVETPMIEPVEPVNAAPPVVRAEKPKPVKIEKPPAKAEPKRVAKVEPKVIEKTKPKARKENVQLAKAEARSARVKAEAAEKKAAQLAKIRRETKTEAALRAKAEARALAKAEARKVAQAEARREAKATKLAQAKAAKLEKAKQDKAAEARQAWLKKEAARKQAKAAGPVRVAAAPRCASSDPGAALVCGDAKLGAVDRRMTRAFQQAEAAGVPQSELQRQQRRWLAARSAAAKEAPWAVHDVYLARIAELQGMARDAREGGDY